MIAFRAGAPDAVKESLLEAWPEVASADGVLAAALTEKWGDAYVARMVASAPEVTHVTYLRAREKMREQTWWLVHSASTALALW